MKISEFWDKMVETSGYTEDDDVVIVSIKSTDITDDELLIHSPFGSFSIIRELDPETKELIDVYEIESSDLKYHICVLSDETMYDILCKMMEIIKNWYWDKLYGIDASWRKPYVVNNFSEPDLYWFVKKYGNRLGVCYDITKSDLIIYSNDV